MKRSARLSRIVVKILAGLGIPKSSGSSSHFQVGIWGEQLAERHLRKKGYRILGRRVRIGKHDELDIVARKDDVLVFLEVKTKSDDAVLRPLASIDQRKRLALARAAREYIQRLNNPPIYYRFDVIEVVGDKGKAAIHHIEYAIRI